MQSCSLVHTGGEKCQRNKERWGCGCGIVAQVGVLALNLDYGIIFRFHLFSPFRFRKLCYVYFIIFPPLLQVFAPLLG